MIICPNNFVIQMLFLLFIIAQYWALGHFEMSKSFLGLVNQLLGVQDPHGPNSWRLGQQNAGKFMEVTTLGAQRCSESRVRS